MELSKNKASGIDRTPWLRNCLAQYFAPNEFVFNRSHLIDIKWRSDGHYCVMLFSVDENFYMVDVAGYDQTYEVCNDSESCDSLIQWKSVKIDPYCDGYQIDEVKD